MSIELMVNGVACNLSCGYCHQNPMRDAGNITRGPLDLTAAFAALEREGVGATDSADPRGGRRTGFAVYGGEALLLPVDELERIFEWGYAKAGLNHILTNGTLITDKHLELFERYNVHVGVSVDGPDELNDSRWAGSVEKTRQMTARTQSAIERLCERGRPPSLILTLYRGNATADRRPRLFDWIRALHARGIRHIRLHVLEVDHALVDQHYALDDDEQLEALVDMATLQEELAGIDFELFRTVAKLLLGQDAREHENGLREGTTCVWGACDPYTTDAVRAVDANGERSNCARTNKEGVGWHKGDAPGYERYLGLYHTPQEHGGCSGCRFFFACKGECPGTGIDGDWRNRSRSCGVWKGLFGHFEQRLTRLGLMPLSRSALRPRVEQAMLASWSAGRNVSIAGAMRVAMGVHGHVESSGDPNAPHGDAPHGDRPHGDSNHGDAPHGDHVDAA